MNAPTYTCAICKATHPQTDRWSAASFGPVRVEGVDVHRVEFFCASCTDSGRVAFYVDGQVARAAGLDVQEWKFLA